MAIELKGITKTFGSVVANDHIDLTVKKGEILALLGENGSGKTTLMNMLSGIYKPDSGEIKINSEPVSIQSPEDSKRLGIGMVHQHFKLVENFTAADNIWIGDEESGQMLRSSRNEKIREIALSYGFEIDPKKRIADMSVSEKQTVEILKVLYYGAEILILDEPTAVLTLQETTKLFEILRKMSSNGCSIIVITHKLNEVLEISDRVTILRKGKSIGTVTTADTNAQELTNMMVGHQVELEIERPDCAGEDSNPVLEVKNISIVNEEKTTVIDNVSFALKRGEILGIAGVSGCGQKELCESIAGLVPLSCGEIYHKGEKITDKTPREIIKSGISMSFIPEDRLGMGLAASLSITENMMLKNYNSGKGPFVERKTARKTAQKIIDNFDISTPSTETAVRRLSGGNVQKVLLGREIDSAPSVIITAYPVRGLDINSSYTIYDTLNRQKRNGVGILFVGEDLDVMLELCDRILVLCHGKVTGIVDAKQTNKSELGLLMTDAFSDNSILETETDEQSSKKAELTFERPVNKDKAKPVKARKPLIRIAKRDSLTPVKATLFYMAAVLIALTLGGILVAALGTNPFAYYKTMIEGCFNNKIYFKNFVHLAIPLIITAIGVSYAFKMKFWNVGANGQFVMGAVAAAWATFMFEGKVPSWLLVIIVFISGALGGGLFGLIPALLKVKFGTNETLMTLMLNYVAYYFLAYLKSHMFFRKLGENGEILRPEFKILPESVWIKQFDFFGAKVDASLFVAVAVVIFTFVYFKYTKKGYEISVVGDSTSTARYAGMNVNMIIIRTMFISSVIIGIAGMLKVCGSESSHVLSESISADVGWTAIIVAWLAKLNPIGIFITSILMSILEKGANVAESVYTISSSASALLQGVILFTVLAADFFIRYKVVLRGKAGEKE